MTKLDRVETSTAAPTTTPRVRQRRGPNTARSVIVFLLATAAMVLIVAINRDADAQRACRKRMEFAREQLQAVYDRREPPPFSLPLPQSGGSAVGDAALDEDKDFLRESEQSMRNHYVYRPSSVPRAGRPAGVCGCADSHRMLFRGAGRHVIIFHAPTGRYELKWLQEADFAAEAPELGLDLPPKSP